MKIGSEGDEPGFYNKGRQGGCRLWNLVGALRRYGGHLAYPRVGDGLAGGEDGGAS